MAKEHLLPAAAWVAFMAGAVVAQDAKPETKLVCQVLGVDFEPSHMVATPDGKHLLLANRETDKIIVWDWIKNEEEKRIPVRAGPSYIFVRGETAFVCNSKGSTLSELDLKNLRVANTIDLPTGQPYYISGTQDLGAPIYVSAGDYTKRKVVLLHPKTEKSKVILEETYMSCLTVHSNGKIAAKQGEFSSSPAASPSIFDVKSDGELGNQLGYDHNSYGLLRPDSRGKYWLGYGGVWDLTLAKQVLKVDASVIEYPRESVLVAIRTGERWGPTNATEGSVSIYNTTKFTSNFTRVFKLPDPKTKNARPNPLATPVVVPSAEGMSVLFLYMGNVARLDLSSNVYSGGSTSRIKTPLPKAIRLGAPWTFQIELDDPTAKPTFKGLELPDGCQVDPATGKLTWASPKTGDYDFAIKVILTPESYFLLEQHVVVVGGSKDF